MASQVGMKAPEAAPTPAWTGSPQQRVSSQGVNSGEAASAFASAAAAAAAAAGGAPWPSPSPPRSPPPHRAQVMFLRVPEAGSETVQDDLMYTPQMLQSPRFSWAPKAHMRHSQGDLLRPFIQQILKLNPALRAMAKKAIESKDPTALPLFLQHHLATNAEVTMRFADSASRSMNEDMHQYHVNTALQAKEAAYMQAVATGEDEEARAARMRLLLVLDKGYTEEEEEPKETEEDAELGQQLLFIKLNRAARVVQTYWRAYRMARDEEQQHMDTIVSREVQSLLTGNALDAVRVARRKAAMLRHHARMRSQQSRSVVHRDVKHAGFGSSSVAHITEVAPGPPGALSHSLSVHAPADTASGGPASPSSGPPPVRFLNSAFLPPAARVLDISESKRMQAGYEIRGYGNVSLPGTTALPQLPLVRGHSMAARAADRAPPKAPVQGNTDGLDADGDSGGDRQAEEPAQRDGPETATATAAPGGDADEGEAAASGAQEAAAGEAGHGAEPLPPWRGPISHWVAGTAGDGATGNAAAFSGATGGSPTAAAAAAAPTGAESSPLSPGAATRPGGPLLLGKVVGTATVRAISGAADSSVAGDGGRSAARAAPSALQVALPDVHQRGQEAAVVLLAATASAAVSTDARAAVATRVPAAITTASASATAAFATPTAAAAAAMATPAVAVAVPVAATSTAATAASAAGTAAAEVLLLQAEGNLSGQDDSLSLPLDTARPDAQWLEGAAQQYDRTDGVGFLSAAAAAAAATAFGSLGDDAGSPTFRSLKAGTASVLGQEDVQSYDHAPLSSRSTASGTSGTGTAISGTSGNGTAISGTASVPTPRTGPSNGLRSPHRPFVNGTQSRARTPPRGAQRGAEGGVNRSPDRANKQQQQASKPGAGKAGNAVSAQPPAAKDPRDLDLNGPATAASLMDFTAMMVSGKMNLAQLKAAFKTRDENTAATLVALRKLQEENDARNATLAAAEAKVELLSTRSMPLELLTAPVPELPKMPTAAAAAVASGMTGMATAVGATALAATETAATAATTTATTAAAAAAAAAAERPASEDPATAAMALGSAMGGISFGNAASAAAIDVDALLPPAQQQQQQQQLRPAPPSARGTPAAAAAATGSPAPPAYLLGPGVAAEPSDVLVTATSSAAPGNQQPPLSPRTRRISSASPRLSAHGAGDALGLSERCPSDSRPVSPALPGVSMLVPVEAASLEVLGSQYGGPRFPGLQQQQAQQGQVEQQETAGDEAARGSTNRTYHIRDAQAQEEGWLERRCSVAAVTEGPSATEAEGHAPNGTVPPLPLAGHQSRHAVANASPRRERTGSIASGTTRGPSEQPLEGTSASSLGADSASEHSDVVRPHQPHPREAPAQPEAAVDGGGGRFTTTDLTGLLQQMAQQQKHRDVLAADLAPAAVGGGGGGPLRQPSDAVGEASAFGSVGGAGGGSDEDDPDVIDITSAKREWEEQALTARHLAARGVRMSGEQLPTVSFSSLAVPAGFADTDDDDNSDDNSERSSRSSLQQRTERLTLTRDPFSFKMKVSDAARSRGSSASGTAPGGGGSSGGGAGGRGSLTSIATPMLWSVENSAISIGSSDGTAAPTCHQQGPQLEGRAGGGVGDAVSVTSRPSRLGQALAAAVVVAMVDPLPLASYSTDGSSRSSASGNSDAACNHVTEGELGFAPPSLMSRGSGGKYSPLGRPSSSAGPGSPLRPPSPSCPPESQAQDAPLVQRMQGRCVSPNPTATSPLHRPPSSRPSTPPRLQHHPPLVGGDWPPGGALNPTYTFQMSWDANAVATGLLVLPSSVMHTAGVQGSPLLPPINSASGARPGSAAAGCAAAWPVSPVAAPATIAKPARRPESAAATSTTGGGFPGVIGSGATTSAGVFGAGPRDRDVKMGTGAAQASRSSPSTSPFDSPTAAAAAAAASGGAPTACPGGQSAAPSGGSKALSPTPLDAVAPALGASLLSAGMGLGRETRSAGGSRPRSPSPLSTRPSSPSTPMLTAAYQTQRALHTQFGLSGSSVMSGTGAAGASAAAGSSGAASLGPGSARQRRRSSNLGEALCPTAASILSPATSTDGNAARLQDCGASWGVQEDSPSPAATAVGGKDAVTIASLLSPPPSPSRAAGPPLRARRMSVSSSDTAVVLLHGEAALPAALVPQAVLPSGAVL